MSANSVGPALRRVAKDLEIDCSADAENSQLAANHGRRFLASMACQNGATMNDVCQLGAWVEHSKSMPLYVDGEIDRSAWQRHRRFLRV